MNRLESRVWLGRVTANCFETNFDSTLTQQSAGQKHLQRIRHKPQFPRLHSPLTSPARHVKQFQPSGKQPFCLRRACALLLRLHTTQLYRFPGEPPSPKNLCTRARSFLEPMLDVLRFRRFCLLSLSYDTGTSRQSTHPFGGFELVRLPCFNLINRI
jgi:hypothetical protein